MSKVTKIRPSSGSHADISGRRQGRTCCTHATALAATLAIYAKGVTRPSHCLLL